MRGPALGVLLLCGACANSAAPPRHGADGLRIGRSLSSDLGLSVDVFFVSEDSVDVEADDWSVSWEHFILTPISALVGLRFHDLEVPPTLGTIPGFGVVGIPGLRGDALEIDLGLRWYPFPEWELQPFLSAEGMLLPAVRLDGSEEFFFGGSWGLGVVWYPTPHWALEVDARYVRVSPTGGVPYAGFGDTLDGTQVHATLSYWF